MESSQPNRYSQVKIPQWLQLGQRVRISFVPSVVKNVAVGATGVVVGEPRAIGKNVEVELQLDNGQKLVWKLDALEPLVASEGQVEEAETVAETVAVEVILPEKLTPEEQSSRFLLERQVERAFYNAGKALQQLQDRQLYRSTHQTFAEYCRERFGFQRRHLYQLIEAAQVFDNLLATALGQDPKRRANSPQILPTSEYQVRSLTKLEPAQQREVWQQAVDQAGGKVPSGRLVQDVVQRLREKTPVPNPYRVGEICELIVRGNPDLRGKGGCWCVVEGVHQFSCTVRAWDGSHQVKIENLQSLDLFPQQQQILHQLLSRLSRLQQVESLESSVVLFLSGLGKKTTLTELEETMLKTLETYYDIAEKN